MSEVKQREVDTNGIRMHIAESGTGPLVVLCHGFPESWYSWRHQLYALAEAGLHVVAPDMRGYGLTERPEEIDRYTLLHLVGDMVGLLDALGEERAVIAGHDWGAPVAWHAALLRPDRFRGVIGLSVPFTPRRPARPTTMMPQTEDALFYQLYFQSPGIAEAEFERDVRPIFERSCYACHGPKKQQSSFRLDRRMAAFKGGDLGPAILPHKSATSPLIRYVAGLDADLVIPPEGTRLTAKEIGILRRHFRPLQVIDEFVCLANVGIAARNGEVVEPQLRAFLGYRIGDLNAVLRLGGALLRLLDIAGKTNGETDFAGGQRIDVLGRMEFPHRRPHCGHEVGRVLVIGLLGCVRIESQIVQGRRQDVVGRVEHVNAAILELGKVLRPEHRVPAVDPAVAAKNLAGFFGVVAEHRL